jgi:hydroxypyruvate isomerase
MSLRVAVTLPTVYPDDSFADATARAAAAGADGIEFFDWDAADLDTLTRAAAEHDVQIAGTLSAAPGASSEGPDGMTDPDCADDAVAAIEELLPVAADLGCDTLIVTTGPEQDHVDRETQYESVVDVLSRAASAAEDAGMTLVLEPLNTVVDHPGYFLTDSAEAFDIIRAVDSPRMKLLYDVYHQQITEGNLIDTLTENVDLVGHIHVADVPGRHEPGTGEINYANVIRALADAGYDGYVGCECFPEGDPDAAVERVVDYVESAN